MSVFKCFFKIVSRNRASLLINIGVFVMLMVMFTALGGSESDMGYNESAVRIAVTDRDNSTLSAALTGYLGERHEIIGLPDDSEKLQDALYYRDVEYILTIPEGFEAQFLNGGGELTNVKLPGSASGIYLDNQIDRYIATTRAYLSADFDLSDALYHTSEDLALATGVEVYGGQAKETPEAYYFFNYLPYVLLALIIAALSPVLMAFHQHDLRRRMDSSSFKLRDRNVQTALGSVTVSLGFWMLFMIAAIVMYRDYMLTENAGLQVLNSLALLTVCVSVAFLLGQLLTNVAALGAVNNAIALGMSFICGVFIQQQYMGGAVLTIGKFLPAYWYVRSNDMLCSNSPLDMSLFGESILIQLGFACAIFAVALLVSRQKRNSPAV